MLSFITVGSSARFDSIMSYCSCSVLIANSRLVNTLTEAKVWSQESHESSSGIVHCMFIQQCIFLPERGKKTTSNCMSWQSSGWQKWTPLFIGGKFVNWACAILWIWKYLFSLHTVQLVSLSLVDTLTLEIIMSSTSPIKSYVKPARDQSLKRN